MSRRFRRLLVSRYILPWFQNRELIRLLQETVELRQFVRANGVSFFPRQQIVKPRLGGGRQQAVGQRFLSHQC